jgi:hypothetical protein
MFTANNNTDNDDDPSDEMNCKHLNVMANNLFSIAQAARVSTRAIFPSPEQFSSIIEQRVFAKCSIHNFLLTVFSVLCSPAVWITKQQRDSLEKNFSRI